ncbi:hypothetical protein VUR80DRAFT_7290 [Thermomyces stellatus]
MPLHMRSVVLLQRPPPAGSSPSSPHRAPCTTHSSSLRALVVSLGLGRYPAPLNAHGSRTALSNPVTSGCGLETDPACAARRFGSRMR